MEQIRIDTGRITLSVNDQNETISFNPEDTTFVTQMNDFLKAVKEKQSEFNRESESLDDSDDKFVELYDQLCGWCEAEIDKLFGPETCRKVFGGDRVLDAYGRFLDEITPHIQKVRQSKMAKYKKGESK